MYGIVDIGSNTIRLVLYQVENGKIRPMLNKKVTAGLAGYKKKGRLSEKGVERLVSVLQEFSLALGYMQTKEVFCFATAPLRGIENAEAVCSAVKERCGFEIRILSGEEEALYDYFGAMQSVDEPEGLVLDIGGGSTEFVFYKGQEITAGVSLPIGSLTAYENYVAEILPAASEEKAISKAVDAELSAVPEISADVICGVGGTIRAAVKIYNELAEKPLPAGRAEVEKLASLLQTDRKTLARTILKVAPERIHTFIPGLILLCRIAEKRQIKEIVVSSSGVREGYLLSRLQEKGVL